MGIISFWETLKRWESNFQNHSGNLSFSIKKMYTRSFNYLHTGVPTKGATSATTKNVSKNQVWRYFGLCLKSCPFPQFVNNIVNVKAVSELLHCPSFIKPRPDNSSTVVVEGASFLGNPVLNLILYFRKIFFNEEF